MIRNHLSTIIITVLTATMGVIAAVSFGRMHHPEELFPSDGLTAKVMLSDYFEGIKGTNGDTEVYIFDSGVEGGTALVCGGAHPNEAASFLSTVVILENLRVTCGRVFIIPRLIHHFRNKNIRFSLYFCKLSVC